MGMTTALQTRQFESSNLSERALKLVRLLIVNSNICYQIFGGFAPIVIDFFQHLVVEIEGTEEKVEELDAVRSYEGLTNIIILPILVK